MAGAGTDIQAYAATDAGLRRSDENSVTWTTPATLAGVPLAAVGATPAEAWAAGPRDGAFRSLDDGLAWTATGALRGSAVAAVSFAGGAARTLWAGGDFGVQRSDDGGATWARREGGLPARPVAVDVLADPFAATTAYAAIAGSGAWRTTDGGATWTAANTGLPSTDVRALLADPQSRRAASSPAPRPASRARPTAAACGRRAAACRPSPCWRSPPIPTGSPLLAGTQGSGLYRSLDGGLTWTATGGAQLAGATVQAVHVAGGVALAAAGTALYRSTDAGGDLDARRRRAAGRPRGERASGSTRPCRRCSCWPPAPTASTARSTRA